MGNRCHCKFEVGDIIVWTAPTSNNFTKGVKYRINFVSQSHIKVCDDTNYPYPLSQKNLKFEKVCNNKCCRSNCCDKKEQTMNKMEIGKQYIWKGSKTVVTCVGYHGGLCIVRYPKSCRFNSQYQERVGEVKPDGWTEYKEPEIVERYTYIAKGYPTLWHFPKQKKDNVKATFVDEELTRLEII